MRRLVLTVLLCACGASMLVLQGCGDTLTQTPENFISPANFYQNKDQARAALNGVYKTLQYQISFHHILVFETPTYPINSPRSVSSARGAANEWKWTPGHSAINAMWRHLYDDINKANDFIANVEGVEMDGDLKAQWKSEARFLRAFHYFRLMTLFGNVPLKTKPTEAPQTEVPQSTPSEVSSFLVDELTAIQGNLPEITEYSGNQKGRINKSAAKVLLAKVYLQRAAGHPPGVTSEGSDLSNAESLLREVKQTGNYQLVDDYGSLFNDQAVNDRNDEAIFTVEHAKLSGQGTVVENWISPRNSNWGIGQWTSVTSNFDFYTSYNTGDERKDASWVSEYTDPDGKTRTFDPFNPNDDNFQEDGASLAKQTYRGGSDIGWTQGWRDWMHLRYADVLLMLAEVKNRQGGPDSEAYDMVDMVRQRAGAPNITRGLSQAQFSDSLYQERMWEFTQELHGWRDCQRFFERCKELVEQSAQLGIQDPPDIDRRPNTEVNIETPKHRLWPIPAPAMSRNPALSQNPGYSGGG